MLTYKKTMFKNLIFLLVIFCSSYEGYADNKQNFLLIRGENNDIYSINLKDNSISDIFKTPISKKYKGKIYHAVADNINKKLYYTLSVNGYSLDNRSYLFIFNYKDKKTSKVEVKNNDLKHITISKDAKTLYISTDHGRVLVFDTITMTFKNEIFDFYEPKKTVLSPDGEKIYVIWYKEIGVYNTKDLSLIKLIELYEKPKDFALSNDGMKLYVSYDYGSSIDKIDTVNYEVDEEIDLHRTTNNIRLSKDQRKLFIKNYGGISILNLNTNKEDSYIDTGSLDGDMAVFSNLIYVKNYDCSCIKIIDTDKNIVLGETTRIPGISDIYGDPILSISN
tara:strand:+ start:2177 stop:3181 length:1005 start_codon:yes stop_codon:yes gene_type:complete